MGIFIKRQRIARLICLVAILSVGRVHALDKFLEMPWWLHESDHFSVVTNIPDRGDQLIQQLELFRAVVLKFTGLNAVEDRLPTRAVIFAKRAEFARITDRANALGYTSTTLRNNRMVASGGSLNTAQRHIMFHEYVHYLLRSATDENHPSWYDEGLADMLSTVMERRGQMVVGTAPPSHLRFINSNSRQVPANKIVNTDDLSDWHPLNVSLFYATSWALVTYIFADKTGERIADLQNYLAAVQRGEPREAAFEDAFHVSARTLQRRSINYIRRHNKAFLRYPREQFLINTNSTARRLSTEEIAYELAYLAMFSNTALARTLIQDVLHRDPHNPSMQTALAVTYQADQEYERGVELARASLREANKQNLQDAVLEIELADMLMVWNQDACASESLFREENDVPQDTPAVCQSRYVAAKQGYQRGLELEPDNPELRAGLAWALLKLNQELPRAARHIEFALDYQPWSPTLQYRAGMIYQAKGEREKALTRLHKALYWSEDAELRDKAAAAVKAATR